MNVNSKKTELEQAIYYCRSAFYTAAFFSLFINLLMITPAIYMLQVYDRVLSSGSESTLLVITLLLVFLFVAMGLLEWMRSLILVRVSSKLETLLNSRLFTVSFKQALYSGGQNSNGQPLEDLTALRQFMTGNGLFAFFDMPWIPIYMAILFLFHPAIGWLAVATAIILVVFAIFNEKSTSKWLQRANILAMQNRSILGKNLMNAEVVESMGMLGNLKARWLEQVDKVLFLQSKASTNAGFWVSLSKVFRMTAQSLVLGLGAYLALQQEISPGIMIAGSILLGRALAPIDLLIGTWKGFIAARGQYTRLNELLKKVPQEEEPMQLPDPEGNILVENILVVPPGGKIPVVKGVNFAVEKGQLIGVIGPSGAGKSTLARALLGVWPIHSGKVRLDGADIAQWDREALGSFIGYLPQDVELFQGTISENIARFGTVDPNKVIAAAMKADVHEFILRMPAGYDTVISGSGGVLSGGERQRIGLARALYGDVRLVVLDEPNSNLDDQGEQALMKALITLKSEQVTVLIISHRPSVLKVVDQIILMKEGVLVDYGTTANVLAKLQPQKKIANQS
ncbi:MAG TPA: type I secretion system permease/ATPase [Methylococcaceae bacterium]|nr:type I secretion system permease/ATPase [Methylococcaceae bacterium]